MSFLDIHTGLEIITQLAQYKNAKSTSISLKFLLKTSPESEFLSLWLAFWQFCFMCLALALNE